MQRLRLIDFRNSGYAADVGRCYGDLPDIARDVSAAQRELLMCKEAGDEGWYGTWAEISFTLSRTAPYYTADRTISRLEMANVCDCPVPINNQFTEYLRFGNGRFPKIAPWCNWHMRAAYTRNSVPTQVDLTNPPQLILVQFTDIADIEASKRVFLQGTDNNNNFVYSQDNGLRVQGIFLVAQSPFTISPNPFNIITGIQKDVTNGPVQIFQLDPTSGTQVLLTTMEATEQVASYRRYYFDSLPLSCCNVVPPPATLPSTVQITAIAKMEPLPLLVDTDYFTLQGEGVLEAITEQCQSKRYRRMDNVSAKAMGAQHHKNAVEILQGILYNYIGKNDPAVQFRPFGNADLRKQKIGTML